MITRAAGCLHKRGKPEVQRGWLSVEALGGILKLIADFGDEQLKVA